MNKTELVTAVAEVSGKPKADVKEVLEALSELLMRFDLKSQFIF